MTRLVLPFVGQVRYNLCEITDYSDFDVITGGILMSAGYYIS